MIAVDSQAVLTGSSGTTNTVSFNNVAGNILFVGLTVVGGDLVTGATYNGVAMTQVSGSPVQVPGDLYIYLFYLANPATGTHDVVISTSGSAYTGGSIVSYSGSNGTINLAGNNTVNPDTSITKSLITTVDNCWIVAFAMADAGKVLSAGASTTLRQAADSTDRAMFDTNAAITPAGSRTITVDLATSDEAAIIAAAFEPETDDSYGNPMFFSGGITVA